MRKIGIIYKLTIISKYKFDSNKPFYIGQHIDLGKFNSYFGSGSIWSDFINKLQKDYPKNWRHFIRREILWSSETCSQKALDKMEEYFIKKEKAHYSYELGGTNVLWGTANKFGSGSPMKDPMVRKKMSEKMKNFHKYNPKRANEMETKRLLTLNNGDYKNRISKTLMGRYKGSKNPNYKNKWTEEQKKALSEKMKGRYKGSKNPNFGNKWTDEQKKAMSEKLNKVKRINPMLGKIRINNGIVNSSINIGEEVPKGYKMGMIRWK